MGTVTTLRPNGYTDISGGWTNNGGAGSIDAALADASDSTYAGQSVPNAVLLLTLDSTGVSSIPARGSR